MSRVDPQLVHLDCAFCGTAIPNAGVDAACPRCGARVAEMVDLSAVDAATATVAVDVACTGCGYNLRTMPLGGICPECARPVTRSLCRDALRFAEVRWLRRVRGGITNLLVAAVAAAGISAISLLGAFVFGPYLDWPFVLIAMVLGVLGTALGITGVYRVTTPEPCAPRGRRVNRWGGSARICTLAALLLVVCVFFASSDFGGTAIFILTPLAFCGAGVSTLLVLKRLAQRERRRGLGRATIAAAWLVGLTGVLTVLGEVLMMVLVQQMVRQVGTGPPAVASQPSVASSPAGATVTTPYTTNVAVYAVGPPTSAPATAATAGVVTARWSRAASLVSFVIPCAVGLLVISASVLGVILLVMYRRMLNSAIVAATVREDSATNALGVNS